MKPPAAGFPPRPYNPGYWRELWMQKKRALYATPAFEQSGTYWNNRKNVTDLYVRSRNRISWQGKVDGQLDAMQIPSGARVLDIGGGTGTHAVPLAGRGCDVTVIEPSGAMREVLGNNLMASGAAGPVTVLPYRWEDVSPDELGDPFDTVIASYSLSMIDIGEALLKMHACCRGTVHLFWFLTPPSWVRVSRDLWPLLHGREYPGEPLADCLWQVLYEAGIYASLVPECKPPTVYRNTNEATREYYQRLNCSTGSQKAILMEYFVQELRPVSGGFVLDGASYSAHIWWKTKA